MPASLWLQQGPYHISNFIWFGWESTQIKKKTNTQRLWEPEFWKNVCGIFHSIINIFSEFSCGKTNIFRVSIFFKILILTVSAYSSLLTLCADMIRNCWVALGWVSDPPHVVACWVSMYFHAELSCNHITVVTCLHDLSYCHAITCHMACIHMRTHACTHGPGIGSKVFINMPCNVR